MPPTEEEMEMSLDEEPVVKDSAVEYMYFLITEEDYPRRKARRKAERLFKRKISEDE